ncbi:hypothetical protein N7449_005027 [Penicillium cf. viridicatum]|uniref:F-box domain-containing protein n=1 Tax=Penicillium cf. viridicatum TaxID=2972119 RepID=A0A9W9MKH2_9EURO|nr:hypothetical protein N7449_005027 [Penicillium cf. viridicatum]
MPNLIYLPNELLLWIVSHSDGSAIFALARSCTILYLRLQPSIWKYNIEFQNSNLLNLAAKTDNVGLAEALLQYNANINAFYRGKTPLMGALKYSSTTVRELLLNRREVDINIQNQARYSALSYAIHYGNFSTVKSVLEQPNVRVDVKHKHGRTAPHLAVFAGRIGPLAMGLGTSLQQAHNGNDFFKRSEVRAVSYRSVDAVKRLLGQKGLNSDIQNRKGYTPLHLAIQSKRLEMVNLLLSHPRINVNCKDKDGNTPLWLSTYSSYDEITKRLLAEKDINVNFVRGCGRLKTPSIPLHHAATRLDTVLLRRLLAVPGMDPNLCVAGHSPISVAAYHGRMNTVACLLSMEGVEINGRDIIDPPLCRAVAHSHLDVVGLLVQQGARLHINESTIAAHDTALCISARGGDLEMVQALLRHDRIDVNIRNRWFEDPLMLAVKGGHFSIVDALVVNPRRKYFSLKRSLDIARDDCIKRAIRSRMEDDNIPQTLLKRSPGTRFGGL